MKLRGSLRYEEQKRRLSMYGDLLGQTFLDALFYEESKLVINSEVGLLYALTPDVRLLGQLVTFHKAFYGQTRSYRWMDYRSSVEISPLTRLTVSMSYSTRSTAFIIAPAIHFHEEGLEIRGRYAFTPRVFVEGKVSSSTINYEDYLARKIQGDVIVIDSSLYQIDESIRGSVHFRYEGNVIAGLQAGYESVRSNSIISDYDLGRLRVYLSGRWAEGTFFHVVFQGIDKDYHYSAVEGISNFRDPEQAIQNRTYVQLERVLEGGSVGFVQFSFLQNETILNQRYYNKTTIECGIKFDL